MTENKPIMGRKNPTSCAAMIAAYALCKKPLDLSNRKPIEGFAVDSADPDTPMDRDDAIGVEHRTDPVHGKVTVLHVTIADVASSCPHASHKEPDPKLAVLDLEAQTNGESTYHSYGVSPMLPRRLQDRLSLENGKERPGLTISVTLDKNANIVHTEFSRTVIRTKCKSYRDAVQHIGVQGHPLQQLSVLSTHVLQNKYEATDLPRYDPLTGMYTDSEGNTRHINIDELSAYTMVQGCMIAANEAAASIMRDSNFLFRNHSYASRQAPEEAFYNRSSLEASGADTRKLIQNRAEYSPQCKGHYGLDTERYSHVTSPIRRYADLVNQRMMHWAIDIVQTTTDHILQGRRHSSQAWERDRIEHHIWENATQLLGDAAEYSELRGSLKEIAYHRLEHTISEIAQKIPGIGPVTGVEIARRTIKGTAEHLASNASRKLHEVHNGYGLKSIDQLELPYTKKELTKVASALNQTLEKNRQNRRESGYSETEARLNVVFPETNAALLRDWDSRGFARLLEGAARRGDNNDIFSAEVLRRLNTDKETMVQNLHTLLVVAERYKDGHWQMLKRQAFQHLKNNPELAESVFSFMQEMQRRQNSRQKENESGDETQKLQDITTYILEVTLLDEKQRPYPSALVVLSNNGQDYSAPIIDTADTPEHARQAAILTFFRHYGDLYQHDALYTPKLIDLALERAKVRKGERYLALTNICAEHFNVQEHFDPPEFVNDEKSVTVTLTVTSLETGEQLIKTRTGKRSQILDKAAKDILQDRRFHDMLTQCHGSIAPGDIEMSREEGSLPAVWAESAGIIKRQQPEQQR